MWVGALVLHPPILLLGPHESNGPMVDSAQNAPIDVKGFFVDELSAIFILVRPISEALVGGSSKRMCTYT